MNVYKVTLSVERHYGNGHVERENVYRNITAKDGDAAVKKAKDKVETWKPILVELEVLITNVD